MRFGFSICLLSVLVLPGTARSGVDLMGQSIDELHESSDAASRSADPSLRLYSMQPGGLVRQRCWSRSRNLLRIGHGAAPDGRPEGCRLLGWNMIRVQRRDWLIGAFRPRPLPTVHDLDVLMWAYYFNPVRPITVTRPRNIHAVFVSK